MKDSFVFYKSFYDAIHKLKDKELKSDIFEAICELALNENSIELTDGVGQIIMDLIRPQILANNKRYLDGKKGGRPKKIDTEKTTGYLETKTTGYENKKPNVNVNENVNVNVIKEENIKRRNFTKPTIEEIQQYCNERNNGINANAFYDFYESKDWLVGKNKMKDWKACVRTWEQRSSKDKITPSWFKKEIKDEKLSEEEMLEMEELLKEYRND